VTSFGMGLPGHSNDPDEIRRERADDDVSCRHRSARQPGRHPRRIIGRVVVEAGQERAGIAREANLIVKGVAGHRAGLNTRAIARANVSHFDVSIVSCLRPAGVSR